MEVVALEVEKSEFCTVINDIRKHFKSCQYAKLIFAISTITKPHEYFKNDGGHRNETMQQTVPTQEIVVDISLGSEKIAKLWYLPHITESMLVCQYLKIGNVHRESNERKVCELRSDVIQEQFDILKIDKDLFFSL